jgi:hypothetical protein
LKDYLLGSKNTAKEVISLSVVEVDGLVLGKIWAGYEYRKATD